MKWHPASKHPKVYPYNGTVSFRVRKNIPIYQSFPFEEQRSKDVLLRFKHAKTHHRLGDKGWGDYPDSQAGKYKYELGRFVKHEDGTSGWELNNDHEADGHDGWLALPNCVAAGYTW